MNIAVFICNTSSAILQSKLIFLFPFGLVLEKTGVSFKHELVCHSLLIHRRGVDVPSQRHWLFQLRFA